MHTMLATVIVLSMAAIQSRQGTTMLSVIDSEMMFWSGHWPWRARCWRVYRKDRIREMVRSYTILTRDIEAWKYAPIWLGLGHEGVPVSREFINQSKSWSATAITRFFCKSAYGYTRRSRELSHTWSDEKKPRHDGGASVLGWEVGKSRVRQNYNQNVDPQIVYKNRAQTRFKHLEIHIV